MSPNKIIDVNIAVFGAVSVIYKLQIRHIDQIFSTFFGEYTRKDLAILYRILYNICV